MGIMWMRFVGFDHMGGVGEGRVRGLSLSSSTRASVTVAERMASGQHLD